MARSKSKDSFEDLYRRLEETVAKLEEGGLSLDQSIALYEEGMQLAKSCQEMLDGAEVRIRKLRDAFQSLPKPEEVGEEELPWEDDAES